MYKISQIEAMVNKINEDIGIATNKLPSYGAFNYNMPNYLTVDKDGYSLFEFDPYHSKEKQHLTIKTIDINELLFEIFKAATRSIAQKYELENRISNQDNRILYFNKHIEILNSLNLEKKFVNTLKEYYDYLLQLERPDPLPDKW